MKRTIKFKSTPDNWMKEFLNIKRNTVRFTDDWDWKRWEDYYYSDIVELQNTKTKEGFARKITDKTTYKNLAIISW